MIIMILTSINDLWNSNLRCYALALLCLPMNNTHHCFGHTFLLEIMQLIFQLLLPSSSTEKCVYLLA